MHALLRHATACVGGEDIGAEGSKRGLLFWFTAVVVGHQC